MKTTASVYSSQLSSLCPLLHNPTLYFVFSQTCVCLLCKQTSCVRGRRGRGAGRLRKKYRGRKGAARERGIPQNVGQRETHSRGKVRANDPLRLNYTCHIHENRLSLRLAHVFRCSAPSPAPHSFSICGRPRWSSPSGVQLPLYPAL